MFAKLYLEIAEAPSDVTCVTSRYTGNRQDADQRMISGQSPVRQCHHYVFREAWVWYGYYWPVFRAQQFLFCGVVLVLSLESSCSHLEQRKASGSAKVRILCRGLGFTQRSVDLQNNPVQVPVVRPEASIVMLSTR
jgi:hypothetical protein